MKEKPHFRGEVWDFGWVYELWKVEILSSHLQYYNI